MGNIDVAWDVEGIITPEESVRAMIQVITSKKIQHSGTFWTWENKVPIRCIVKLVSTNTNESSRILGKA